MREPDVAPRLSRPPRHHRPADAFRPAGLILACLTLTGTLAGCGETLSALNGRAAAPASRESFLFRKPGAAYPSLAPLLRRVTPAVVNVAVDAVVRIEENPLLSDPDFRRFMERFGMEVPEEGDTERRQSVGSGLIVDSGRGYVLTNKHLLEGATAIEVTLKDRRSYRARLLGSDDGTDLAVLQIPAIDITPLAFGDSKTLEVGDFVIAVGNPFGLGQTVTSGIVSAVGRSGVGDARLGELVQTDASINPGNSGGPLINLAGEVVGINTALMGPTGGNVGIGFAVPSNRARAALARVLARRRGGG